MEIEENTSKKRHRLMERVSGGEYSRTRRGWCTSVEAEAADMLGMIREGEKFSVVGKWVGARS